MDRSSADHHALTRFDLLVLLAIAEIFVVSVWNVYRPYTFLTNDGCFYATTTRALAEGGTLRMERFHPMSWYFQDLGWNRELDQGWSDLSVGVDGSLWPKHPFLISLFALPSFLLLGVPGFLLFNVAQTVLGVFGGYRIARHIDPEVPAWAPAVAALAAIVWSPLRTTSYGLSNDLFYSALIVWGVERALARRAIAAGLLLGLSIFAKSTNVILVAPLAVWLFVTLERPGSRVAFLSAMAVPVGMLGAIQAWCFGAPWTSSYLRVLARTLGASIVQTHTDAFARPTWLSFISFWSDQDGLARWSPAMAAAALAAIVPLPRLGRARGARLAYLSCLAIQTLFLCGYTWREGRFFFALLLLGVPFLARPLGALVASLGLPLPASVSTPIRRASRTGAMVLGCIVCASFALGFAHRPGRSWRLSEHVEEARVFLGDIPCDYFAMQYGKWECSHHDVDGEYSWGRPMNGQCRVNGSPGPAFFAPAAPSLSHRLRATLPEDVHSLALELAVGDGSAAGDQPVRVLLDGALVWTASPVMGALRRTTLEIPARQSESMPHILEVEVTPATDYRAVCVDAYSSD